jgi:hypothetical protein
MEHRAASSTATSPQLDLVLKALCEVCDNTSKLYDSACKHMMPCLSCGKCMSADRHRCHLCVSSITKLIREYYVKGIVYFRFSVSLMLLLTVTVPLTSLSRPSDELSKCALPGSAEAELAKGFSTIKVTQLDQSISASSPSISLANLEACIS